MNFSDAVYLKIQESSGQGPISAAHGWLMKEIESRPPGTISPSVAMLEQSLKEEMGCCPTCCIDWTDDSTIASTAKGHGNQALPGAFNWQQILALITTLLQILGPIFGS